MYRRTLSVLSIGLAVLFVFGARADETTSTAPGIPEAKQTTLDLYVTAAEAYGMWKAEPDHVKVLDVRTPEEYIFIGHAEMAWNIPVVFQTYEWQADRKRFKMRRNADFVSLVRDWAEPDDTILVICRSGARGAIAVNLLAEAGFRNVYNVVDGMEGDTVRDAGSVFRGKRMKNGWKNAGLPWTYELDPQRMRLPTSG